MEMMLMCNAHEHAVTATKFCMVIKLDEMKIFEGSTTPPALPWPKFIVTRMQTRDLFAEANPFTVITKVTCRLQNAWVFLYVLIG